MTRYILLWEGKMGNCRKTLGHANQAITVLGSQRLPAQQAYYLEFQHHHKIHLRTGSSHIKRAPLCNMSYWMVCRCVIMVGMPFPNPKDPELLERMKSLDLGNAAAATLQGKASPGQTYYGDLCMKVKIWLLHVLSSEDPWHSIWTFGEHSCCRLLKLHAEMEWHADSRTSFDAFASILKACKADFGKHRQLCCGQGRPQEIHSRS